MKSKVLGIIIVVLLIGYSAFWYMQAYYIQNTLKQELAEVSEAKITYDDVKCSGFPFRINVSLVNPKVHVENKAISLDLDGQFVTSWSLLANLKGIDISGKSHILVPVEEGAVASQYHFEGNTALEIDSIKTLGDKGKVRLTDAKAVSLGNDLHGPFEWLADSVTCEYNVLSSSPDRAALNLDVEVQGAQVKVLLAGESTFIQQLYNAFFGTIAEKSGKTNASFVISCDTPSASKLQELADSPLQLLTKGIPPVTLEIKNFNSSNALTKDKLLARLHLGEEHNSIVLQVTGEGDIRYFAAYREAIIAAIDNVEKLAPNWEAPADLLGVKDFLVNHADRIKALVPHPERLGTISLYNDFFVEVTKPSLNWHVGVKKLGVMCDLYGIDIKADAQSRNSDLQIEATCALKNAQGLVVELVSSYNNVADIVNTIESDPEKHFKPLPANAADKIVAFLAHLSQEHEDPKGTLKIIYTYKNNKTMIGHLSLEEARAEAEALWAAIMGNVKQEVEVPAEK